jgi:putative transcriptional regulator
MSDALAPGLLVAVPQLQDPNFKQSVVLLLQHSEDGALGVVVNHESPLLLKDLCTDHEIRYAGPSNKKVRRGGPVQQDQGLVLYGPEHDDPEGQEVIDGLHVSASRETLNRLCTLGSGRFHCYSGYAGWGPNQLEDEIRTGSWLMAPVDPIVILDTPTDDVWNRVMDLIGIDPALLVPGGNAEA